MERQLKYSGNPIIGNIPEDWQLMRLKDIGYLYGGLTGKAGDDFDVNEDKDKFAFFIPFTNIFNNTYISRDNLAKVKVSDGENQNGVHKGDLLFLMSSEDYDGIGKPAVIDFELDNLYLNSFCKGFRITTDINSRFLNYLMSSHVERELVRLEAKGFIRINLRQDKLACCTIVVPKRKEQDSIADYLDEKCGEIDSLIGLQEQMIEKLKAYKQSVITEAVTKGLNTNAKLVPSDIDWIGEIPEGWSITVLRRFANIILGKMLQPNTKFKEDTLEQYICAKDVHFEGIDTSDLKKMYFNKLEKEMYQVQKGDMLVVEGGAGAAGSCVLKTDLPNTYIQNSIMIVRPKQGIDIRFIQFYEFSLVKKGYVDYVCNKATIPHFTKDKLSSMPIPLPPLSEQQAIVSYLDEKCTDIDRLIALKQQKIESLKNYKKSVIYEAVTGKTIIE